MDYGASLLRLEIEQYKKMFRYIFEHHGEVKPGNQGFESWLERIATEIRRGYY